jgi:hypothetical protein
METDQLITKLTPTLKRIEKLAIEIRDLINEFQERENTYNNGEVINSVLKVASPFIIKNRNEMRERCKNIDYSFYINILDNYLEMASNCIEDYWDMVASIKNWEKTLNDH